MLQRKRLWTERDFRRPSVVTEKDLGSQTVVQKFRLSRQAMSSMRFRQKNFKTAKIAFARKPEHHKQGKTSVLLTHNNYS